MMAPDYMYNEMSELIFNTFGIYEIYLHFISSTMSSLSNEQQLHHQNMRYPLVYWPELQ